MLLVLLLTTASGCTSTTPSAAPGTHVIAWIQQDSNSVAQVWASFDDQPPRQITHRQAPPATCGMDVLGPPMFSPDLRHIAVAGGDTCGQGQAQGPLYLIDEATGAISSVPLPGTAVVLTNQRAYGWLDNQTIFAVGAFGAGVGGVTYALGASSVNELPGLPGDVPEAVARGHVLFYVSFTEATVAGVLQYSVALNRYDLAAHVVLSGAIDLGTLALCACATGDYHLQGWDASPDGGHVVYQKATPQAPKSAAIGIASQAIYYAGADGSGVTQIVKAVTTQSPVRLRFSPDGAHVGITEARDTPDVASGCVDSAGLFTDPCMQFYGPDAVDYPAWHWDSTFMVATAAPSSPDQIGSLYRYQAPRFHGTLFAASGYNPWSTP